MGKGEGANKFTHWDNLQNSFIWVGGKSIDLPRYELVALGCKQLRDFIVVAFLLDTPLCHIPRFKAATFAATLIGDDKAANVHIERDDISMVEHCFLHSMW